MDARALRLRPSRVARRPSGCSGRAAVRARQPRARGPASGSPTRVRSEPIPQTEPQARRGAFHAEPPQGRAGSRGWISWPSSQRRGDQAAAHAQRMSPAAATPRAPGPGPKSTNDRRWARGWTDSDGPGMDRLGWAREWTDGPGARAGRAAGGGHGAAAPCAVGAAQRRCGWWAAPVPWPTARSRGAQRAARRPAVKAPSPGGGGRRAALPPPVSPVPRTTAHPSRIPRAARMSRMRRSTPGDRGPSAP